MVTVRGKWTVDVHPRRGLRIRRRVTGSYRDARAVEAQLEVEVGAQRSKGAPLTIEDAIFTYDSTIARDDRRWRAELAKLERWRDWIGPKRQMRRIDRPAMNAYAGHLSSEGLSGRTVRRHLSRVSTLFHFYVQRGRLDENPVKDCLLPTETGRVREGLSQSEVGWALEAVRGHSPLEPAYLLTFVAGLRLSEAVRACMEDVSLDEPGGPRIRVRGKKSHRSTAWIPVLPALERWLRENWRETGPIIANSRGDHYHVDSLHTARRRFSKTLDRELPTFHLGRHSIGDYMVNVMNASFEDVAAVLRNSRAVVEAHYAHLRATRQRTILGEYLQAPPSGDSKADPVA